MSVTLIISVWNSPENLALLLDCISRQTVLPDQVIIVDDYSDPEYIERHRKIIAGFHELQPDYIFLQRDPKMYRLCTCLNLALSLASGEYVGFIGVNNMLLPEYLEQCISIMAEYRNIVLFQRCLLITVQQYEQFLIDGIIPKDLPVYANHKGDESYWSHYGDIHPTTFDLACDGNVFIRTEQAKRYNVWDANLVGWGGGRADMARTCLMSGLSCVAVWDIFYLHMSRDKSSHYTSNQEAHDRYLQDKWSATIIPTQNPLRPIKEPEVNIPHIVKPLIEEPVNLYYNPAPVPSVEWGPFPEDVPFEEFDQKMQRFNLNQTIAHAKLLYESAKSGPGEGYIIEFGTWWGSGACYLGAGSKTVKREHVITVDIDRGSRATLYSDDFWNRPPIQQMRVHTNLIMTGVYDWVIPVRCSTHEFLRFFSAPIRVLSIDAGHTYDDVKAEVIAATPFLIPGAILIFHDRSMEGVARAIQECVQESPDFSDVTFVDFMTATATKL